MLRLVRHGVCVFLRAGGGCGRMQTWFKPGAQLEFPKVIGSARPVSHSDHAFYPRPSVMESTRASK